MNGYVAAGYFIPIGILVLYSARVVLRGRALRRTLPSPDLDRSSQPDA